MYVGLAFQIAIDMELTKQANAGDSRTVLGVKGRAKPLSFDHKPQNEGTYANQVFCMHAEHH